MQAFLFCNIIVESNIFFPELIQAVPHGTLHSFYVEKAVTQSIGAYQWLHHWRWPDGQIELSYTRQGSGHRLRFPALADFEILPEVSTIRCYPTPDTPLETVRHLFLDQVLPRYLTHQGKLMVHGSVVSHPQGALIFVGSTGAGKSTLATSFHQHGWPLLADDCFLLTEHQGQAWCIPSYQGVRLWRDSLAALFEQEPLLLPLAHYTSKNRVMMANNSVVSSLGGIPIHRAYFMTLPDMSTGDQLPAITPLTRRDAFIALAKQIFQLDVTDRHHTRTFLASLAKITNLLCTFQLSLPHNYALLPTIRQAILDNTNG